VTVQSRRQFVAHALCGCAAGFASANVFAKTTPAQLKSLVPIGYQPTDADERGLWSLCDRLEKDIADSNLRLRDEGLNKYIHGVTTRILGTHTGGIRIYVMRNPDFNAAMAPNGMMIVNSGFLARVRNEAQMAAVLGHECGHYMRLHSVRGWRDMKAKSAVMAFITVAGAGVSGATGSSWYDLANAINSGLLASMFSFSREMESEADAFGIKLMRESGYAPHEASSVWSQLIEERKAAAAARKKRYRDNSVSAFSTHPPSSERMFQLKAYAMEMEGTQRGAVVSETRRAEFLAATAGLRSSFIEEQVKLNDPGGSLYLLNNLAQDGWDGVLRYSEGEVYRLRDEEGDAQRAAEAFAQAVAFSDAPAEAHRAHGYALLKSGQQDAGRRALSRYLELQPGAADAAMIRFTIGQ
jgi:beta-barrel assembly-enhancing protease